MVNDTKSVRDDVVAGHARLAQLVAGLADADVRAPSALPGWSRGHVLTHLADVADAYRRQAEYALAGKVIDFYDGGRPAALAAVEAGSGRSADELQTAVVEASAELESVWAQANPDDWARPVRYRDGVLMDTVFARWREVEIHTVDLNLGYRPRDWAPDLCVHVVRFLLRRVPETVALTLRAGEHLWTQGSGTPVEVSGALTDVAAWLAGRNTDEPLIGNLPELLPWP